MLIEPNAKNSSRQLGFILAGGLSSRMGQDKATVMINGLSMLEIAKRLLDTLPLDAHYVVGGQFGTFPEQSSHLGPGRAVSDILLALEQQEAGIAVFLPVDMPLLDTSSMYQLLDYAKQQQHACYYDNCFLPAAIPITRQYTNALSLLVKNTPNVSLRKVLACCEARPIQFTGNTNILMNVNSPEALTNAVLNRVSLFGSKS